MHFSILIVEVSDLSFKESVFEMHTPDVVAWFSSSCSISCFDNKFFDISLKTLDTSYSILISGAVVCDALVLVRFTTDDTFPPVVVHP